MWDAAAKGQEQVSGENSFWQKRLLRLNWIHRATLIWGRVDPAALCWSGRPLVQLHPLHYHWLPPEPLSRQFWAINWQRIRERTLQSHRLLHHFQFASWRGQQDGLNSSSSVYLGYSLTPSHYHFSAAFCPLTVSAERVSLLNSSCWGSFLLLQQAWRPQTSLFLDGMLYQLTI